MLATAARSLSSNSYGRSRELGSVPGAIRADHPNTLTSMANLASTYRNQGRWADAEALWVQVMETSKTKLGADHHLTLTSMNNLAFTFKGLGKVKEAFSLIQDCCRLQDEVLGSYHPHTLSSQATLTAWQQEAIDISE